MTERKGDRSKDRLERLSNRALAAIAVGGLAVTAAAGAYILEHHVKRPEDAVSITLGDTVIGHLDNSEIAAGAAGFAGLIVFSIAATEALLKSPDED